MTINYSLGHNNVKSITDGVFMKLFIFIVLFSMILFSTGCTIDPLELPPEVASSSEVVEDPFPTPQESLEDAFTSLKNGEIDTLKKYIQTDTTTIYGVDLSYLDEYNINEKMLDEMAEEITVKLYNNLELEILGSQIKGDSATVTAVITTADGEDIINLLIEEFATTYTKSLFSGEKDTEILALDFYNGFKDSLDSSDLQLKNTETKFNLIKGEENWIILTDEDFFDDITGGSITASKRLIEMVGKFM